MDCTPICRLASHADVVLSAVTREQLDEIKCFVKYFCGNGARVCDSFGRNAVHVAASCGKKDVLKWLIEQGQQEGDHGNDGIIGVKDGESGWTALHRSCFYGYLSCALILLQFGANIYEKDSEGISPVELLMLDSPRKAYSRELYSIKKQTYKKGTCVDISSWGRNTNFTLGHGDEKERYIPEAIDIFARRVKISIRDVVICKFHSVILAENGSVWTCGHGQGGRLGHGHEKTILVPKKIDALSKHTCIAIAAGQDHSVVLCENGNVFTFGLNNYHQMGHQPPLSQYLSPKQIQAKPLRDKKFVGIAAGKYHTIVYTRKEVYSCGLNSGQLGHSKGDRTQILPRQVSAMHLRDMSVSMVACNDAAMACVTDGGDVYLIYQFTQRKIISKFSSISKLVIIGGRLDESHFKDVTEKKCSQVMIYGLYEDGKVFQWRQNDKCVRECHWSLRKALSVADIACGKNVHIVTAHGEVYFEEGLSASLKKPSKILSRNQNFVSSSHALKQDEVIEISVTRVSHLHRAVKIVCDEHSQNFAVLQADPSIGCTITPRITPPEMKEHLAVLFDDAQIEDNVHDVEIKVKGRNLAAHRLILAEGSDKFRSLIDDSEAKLHDDDDLPSGVPIVTLDDEDFELIQEMLEFLYTGSCACLRPPEEESRCVGLGEEDVSEIPNGEERMLNELVWSLESVDFGVLDDLHVPLSPAFDALRDEKDAVFSAREERPPKLRRHFTEKIKDGIPERVARRKELLCVAKKYRITELVSSLQNVTNDKKMSCKRFNRKRFTEYHDVVIEAEDDVEYACHKCILVSRLEYFYNMLTTSWMESSGGCVRLKMPIPSNILKVIIDFLYTDEASTVKESLDLEFLGKVLTVADQLWIIRLKEICEAKMASLISLKNAVEMLEFSSLYNADQLKNVCLEFICLNMSCLFEAGSLEFLSEDVLDELSKAYRKMIPAMAWRVVTPSDIHLSVPCPQPESPTKRKGTRSQRRSRASESDVDGHPGQQTDKSHEVEISGDKVEEDGDISSHELVEKAVKNAGSPEHVPDKVKERHAIEQVGLWYHKNADIKLKPVSPTFVPNAGTRRVVSNPVPISRRRKGGEKQEKQSWASHSLSPQSSNLRAIMEQEKTRSMEEDSPINERKKEGKSPLSSKSRISQKERKKLRMSLEEKLSAKKDTDHEETSDNNLTKSPASPGTGNPWKCSPNGRPAVSFRELLEEEETRVVTAEEKKSTLPKECPKNFRARNLDVGHKNTSHSAWQNGNLACSPPNNPIKFDKIQELQEQETVNRERSMKKPLSLIQIEDKAIEELLEHYGGRYNPCELIVVERETRSERSPNWVTKLHKTA